MAVTTHPPAAKRPRRTLARGIIKGSLIGSVIGLAAAAILVFSLVAVRPTEQLAVEPFLYLGFEAGFAGALIGGLLAGLSQLRNTR